MPKGKYTDEALSRILSEHAANKLVRSGSYCWRSGLCCINQAAFNDPLPSVAKFSYGSVALGVASWFDNHYRSNMSAETVLSAIERLAGGAS